MRDYAELVKCVRCCAEIQCETCPRGDVPNEYIECRTRIADDAADAIEELLVRDVVPTDFHERCLQLEIRKRIELEKQMPHWISVEERLPHYLDHVLCVNKFGIQMVGYLTDYKEGGFRCESGMDSCDYITHWMPLPEPPKGVE